MTNISFLEKLSKELIENYKDNLSEIQIVLPNKRAKIFLIEALRKNITTTVFAPDIISIEEFIQHISGIRTIDNVTLLFEFYKVYLNITEKEKQQPFEQFANRAKTILQDFNEIDRYLLNPNHVFFYLKDIEDIKHWSLDLEKRTPLIENYLAFWNILPDYYESLYNHLLRRKIGYQGLIYREAVKNLNYFSAGLKQDFFIFAGFNALNAAEEKIIQHLINIDKAKIYWDIDQVFIEDQFHDAGYFVREFKKKWEHYKTHPFRWIFDDFNQQKNIQIIGTPKTVGQAKIVGNIIEKEVEKIEDANLQNIAIVLGEEDILIPLLYSLPSNVGSLNITMGYSGKNNPVQLIIDKLFRLHIHAKSRGDKSYAFYYKELLEVLMHPLIEPFVDASDIVNIINSNNFTFITYHRLIELKPNPNALFRLLFERWETSSKTILENIALLLLMIKDQLNNNNEQEKITKVFVYAVYKTINKLTNYFVQFPYIDKIDTLYAIYKQVIDLEQVSFEGEPLKGLQIMGVLESRVLDFETVIITSVNEGRFPSGKSQDSFIPYDVKRELGLPTYKEKDAIYSYHFYHLLQRAKNIYLLYNTENEGLDAGEKSRFITQLEVEKRPKHTIVTSMYNAYLPKKAYNPIVIPKSEKIMFRLKEIAQSGFSPSALTSYIRNPLQFYFQRVLCLKEIEEVEENIAVNTLGTIIHETLCNLYRPYITVFLKETDIEQMIKLVEDEVLRQFELIYKFGEIKKGKNLLVFEVAKRNVYNFLNQEKALISAGDTVKIMALEQTYKRTLVHPKLPFPVVIKGNVDRIEQRNGKIRIIDYKTGKVEQRDITINQWNGLVSDIKNDKTIQVLTYAYMFLPQISHDQEMEVGIISFKNLKNGFLPFRIVKEKEKITTISSEILNLYIEELVFLLAEILNQDISFVERGT